MARIRSRVESTDLHPRSEFRHSRRVLEHAFLLSVAVRSVCVMSELQDHEATEPPPDAVTVRLDEILDELAAIVADNSTVSDCKRIDRMLDWRNFEL
jgi:hypothetical protein